MRKKIILEELAAIRSGYTARSGSAKQGLPTYPTLQIRDFDETSHSVRLPLESRVTPSGNVQDHFLKPEDIVFLSKGTRHLCFAPGPMPEPTLAADSFFVISLKTNMLPEYLVWFLNLPSTRHALERDAGGSRIPIIRIDALRTLPVAVPALQTQHRIANLVRLHHRETELLLKLAQLRSRQINHATQILSRA
jgi:hypothetical protein